MNLPDSSNESINFQILKKLTETEQRLQEIITTPKVTTEWLPRAEVMKFFDYGDTQMAALERGGELVVAKVGNRKFIERSSILRLLEASIQKD